MHPGGTCWVELPPWASDYNVPLGGQVSAAQARDLATRLYRETLVRAIESAATKPTALQACNSFVGAIGESLGLPYFNGSVPNANDIYNYFSANAPKPADPRLWRSLGSGFEVPQAQALADRGFFVFGCAHSAPESKNGHVAIVAPSFLAKDPSPVHPGTPPHPPGSRGPWIRDAHLPGQNKKPDYHIQSVRASNCFGSSAGTPIWVAYTGDGFPA